MPRYSAFWNVSTIISYLKNLETNDGLTLKQLTLKEVILLALTRPSRSADLSQLKLHWRSYQSEGKAEQVTQAYIRFLLPMLQG